MKRAHTHVDIKPLQPQVRNKIQNIVGGECGLRKLLKYIYRKD